MKTIRAQITTTVFSHAFACLVKELAQDTHDVLLFQSNVLKILYYIYMYILYIYIYILIFISYTAYLFNNIHLLYCLYSALIHYTGTAREQSYYYFVERNGSGVELRTLDYENPGSNPVLRC